VNIIVAEDDAVTRLRIAKFLRKWGHQVAEAGNGCEALEKFLTRRTDIVITDWMMPEMDGPELVRKIRDTTLPYVYIIILTAKSGRNDLISALFEIGADDYMMKPFDAEELQARLHVGERIVGLERNLRAYSGGLERIVREQTRMIRKTQEETIDRLLAALESRDGETGSHVRRIGMFSDLMGKELGWTTARLEDLRLAAPMHDIGKIGVPDKILLKPGLLTDEERDVIRTHTTIGGSILNNSDLPMLKMASEIALRHHEWWDGHGYPHGVSDEEIPESARIVAITDVFDALSNDRIYRKALPEDEVLKIMKKGRGSQFDPDLYDLFMDLLPNFRDILKKNP